MPRCLRSVVLISSLITSFSLFLIAQEDAGRRISPENINIQMGDDRALQLLDDSAQELRGAVWSVDDPAIADIQGEEDGRATLHAKRVGTVRVSAALDGTTRFRDIKIWSPVRPLPQGTTRWGNHPIGRDAGDIPAVPTPGGVTMLSLEQTDNESTYLRGMREDGIQLWAWLMPEKTRHVELICGDWMGGALIAATHEDSFTLYTVGKDGVLRWAHSFSGVRKGQAYNLQHLIHVLSQSVDGTVTQVTGIDEVNGHQRFQLTTPASHEKLIKVGTQGTQVVCASTSATNPLLTAVSRISVNMDGYAYIAFTKNEWELEAQTCAPGAVLDPHNLTFGRDEKLLLWQIHPDGTYRSSVVESSKAKGPLSDPVSPPSPTGAILTDNMNGILLSVRFTHTVLPENVTEPSDEYVYRIDSEGEVVYKFLLPRYSGELKDEMVIGSDNLAFATRGSTLIAFNQRIGKELWRWESGTPEISVFAALANGDCAVQTPSALVEVEGPTKSKELLKGQVIMGWDGQMYRKHIDTVSQ